MSSLRDQAPTAPVEERVTALEGIVVVLLKSQASMVETLEAATAALEKRTR